jgi:hypothetical protein
MTDLDEAAKYILDNFYWKAGYENSELIESRLEVDNSVGKGISLFYRHLKQKDPRYEKKN